MMKTFQPRQVTAPIESYLKDSRLLDCQEQIKYTFKEPVLLLEALWHSSRDEIENMSYERFEFLGDTVLQFITGLHLFELHPDEDEGLLTKRRSNIVSAKALSVISKANQFDQFIFIDDYLQKNISASILCDLYESILAAIYLDGGLAPCETFVMRTLKDIIIAPLSQNQNYKTELQEWLQKNKFPLPDYEVISKEGPDHNAIFVMTLHLNDTTYGPIKAKSKKEGEQMLAKLAYDSLGL